MTDLEIKVALIENKVDNCVSLMEKILNIGVLDRKEEHSPRVAHVGDCEYFVGVLQQIIDYCDDCVCFADRKEENHLIEFINKKIIQVKKKFSVNSK